MKICFLSDHAPKCWRTLRRSLVPIVVALFVVWYFLVFRKPDSENSSTEKAYFANSLFNVRKEVSSSGLVGDLTKAQVASGTLNVIQNDSRLLKYIQKNHLTPPATSGTPNFTHLAGENMNFTVQQEVFRYVINLLKQKTEGFFIECGANDGEYYSNTVHLEADYKWTGLLIEPDPRPFPRLIARRRRAWIANVCLSTENSPKEIKMMGHKMELLTFVKGSQHWNAKDVKEFSAQCFPLFSILSAIGVTTVDYFSLDIEGVELGVLKTIPWDSVIIKVLSIEASASRVKPVREYMESVGYKFSKFIKNKYSHDLIYVHPSVIP